MRLAAEITVLPRSINSGTTLWANILSSLVRVFCYLLAFLVSRLLRFYIQAEIRVLPATACADFSLKWIMAFRAITGVTIGANKFAIIIAFYLYATLGTQYYVLHEASLRLTPATYFI